MNNRRRAMGDSYIINGYIQDSLSKFIKVCQSGKAPERYKLHHKIMVPYNNGSEKLAFEIVGFNVDDKSDGSGKAKVSLLSVDCPANSYTNFGTYDVGGSYPDTYYCYYLESNGSSSQLRYVFNNTILPSLPEEIRSALVCVKKTYKYGKYDRDWGYHSHIGNEDNTSNETVFPPSLTDMQNGGLYNFDGNSKRVKCVNGTNDPVPYFLLDYPWIERSTGVNGSITGKRDIKWNVSDSGEVVLQEGFDPAQTQMYSPVCICIG